MFSLLVAVAPWYLVTLMTSTVRVSELKHDDRMYHLLEHVGTKPNVFYHVKVRNTNEA